MANTIFFNHEEGKIVQTSTFAKKARNMMSQEYEMLQRARRDYPNYTVTVRTIKRNTSQEHFRGLTYEFMRWYIVKDLDSDEAKKTALAEFDDLLIISKAHSTGRRYPTIKKWFLEK